MKGRVIVLDTWGERQAAALVVDGVLQDLAIDPADDSALLGAIYRGTVDRLIKGQGGVFVRLPEGRSGFLRQVSGLAPGQSILVQVTGTAEPGKALPVTTRLLVKSRYAIITPGAPGLNISRRIHDEDTRADLEALAKAGMEGAPRDLGLILRSACDGADEAEVAEDILEMRDLALAILNDADGAPELLVDGPSAHEVAWREWADPAPDEIVQGSFAEHGVDDMLEGLLTPRIDLPGGGHAWMEPTRALVAVDVNTGPDTSPAASLKVNIAMARDLARQLRLRGLGGQVVLDFAPMPKKDRATLDQVLRAAFKGESSETSLSGWTNLGLYEMVRKRDRAALADLLGSRG